MARPSLPAAMPALRRWKVTNHYDEGFIQMTVSDQEIISRFPVGYYTLHPNVSLNFQLNRFYEWANDKEMLDEMLTASTRISSYADWTREMLELSDKALAAGRTLAAAYYSRGAQFFLDPGDPRYKPTFLGLDFLHIFSSACTCCSSLEFATRRVHILGVTRYLDGPAGPQSGDGPGRPDRLIPVLHPGPRRQVHGRVRRGLRRRGRAGGEVSAAGASGKLLCRTLCTDCTI